VTIHIVDKGIQQPWYGQLPAVTADGASDERSIFGSAARDIQHITIRMPSDDELAIFSGDELRQDIASQLHAQIDRLAQNGARNFEIELIEHINAAGYFDFVTRQPEVKEFGDIAYGGIADVVNSLRHRTSGIAVDATLGSNGTFMFANAIEGWGGIRDVIDRVTAVNGRAWWNDMLPAAKILGGGGTDIRLITSDHDFPALSTSIANRNFESLGSTANVTLLHIRAEGDQPLDAIDPFKQHIRSMIDGNTRFDVSVPGGKELGTYTRADLMPPLTFEQYNSAQGHLPAVGLPSLAATTAASHAQAQQLGGVSLAITPEGRPADLSGLRERILKGRGNGPAWSVQP